MLIKLSSYVDIIQPPHYLFRKKNKKKAKQQEDAKTAEPEGKTGANTKKSDNKNKQKKKKQQSEPTSKKTATTSKKADAVKPAPKPKKQSPPNDGGGWVTAGSKKKKQQPRGGYNPNGKQQESSTYVIPTAKVGILIGSKVRGSNIALRDCCGVMCRDYSPTLFECCNSVHADDHAEANHPNHSFILARAKLFGILKKNPVAKSTCLQTAPPRAKKRRLRLSGRPRGAAWPKRSSKILWS